MALPWLAGSALLAATATRNDRYNAFLVLGYGLPLGVLITAIAMRVSSVALSGFSFAFVAGVLLLIAVGALVVYLRRQGMPRGMPLPGRAVKIDWLVVVLLAVVVFRLGHLVAGAAVQPLVGADTWWFWASKARVWYETGYLASFVSYSQWVATDHAGAMVYADPKSGYPTLVPLSKTWIALAMGRWDEALTNAMWPALFVALLFAFHGQLRLVAGQRYSMLFTALLAGIPLLNMNVFGAGLADLFVAVGFGLAVMALYQVSNNGDRWQWLLFGVGVLFCVWAKPIGILLALCLVPGVALLVLPRRIWWWLMGLGIAGIVVAAVAFVVSGVELLGLTASSLKLAFHGKAVLPFFGRVFVEEGWHLLWYALPVRRGGRVVAPENGSRDLGGSGPVAGLRVCVSGLRLYVYDLRESGRAGRHTPASSAPGPGGVVPVRCDMVSPSGGCNQLWSSTWKRALKPAPPSGSVWSDSIRWP